MNNWIKIENNIFFVKESNVAIQFSTGSHASIEVSIDIKKYPQYLNYFFTLFENHSKFNLETKKYFTKGTIIKSINYDSDCLLVSLRCDIMELTDLTERRDEIIENILNNEDKNNIN